ncbi:MAG: cytochrome c biogenesis protein CcdA [Acidobacteriota bacterium]
MCVPYRAELVSEGPVTISFSAASPATAQPSTVAPDDTAKAAAALGEQLGLGQFLLLAVAGGLFTLLMPCTYPMIPITISFFTKQATMRNGKVAPLAIVYGLGIVAIFVFIGVVLGSLIIPFATNPITNLLIGLLFLIFALTLFGALDLPVPSFLLDAAGSASQSGGYLGVFLMGAALVITSFTCTVPFVGSLLSVGAQQGQLLRIALGMAVFGLTMAIPFVLLSLLPGRLGAMPRSGEWMHHLKVFLGFVEIAAALKFISNSDLVWGWGFLTRELFLVLWFGIFLAAALYLFGLVRLEGDSAEIRPMRMSGALVTLLFSLYCGYGALGHELDSVMTAIAPNYSRPLAGTSQSSAGQRPADSHTIVVDDYDAARETALQQARPLLVNLTGHTCVNCRLMEEKVFRQPAVAAELENVIEARLHTDGRRNLDRILALQNELTGVTANPFYVMVDPKSGQVVARFAGATRDEQAFIDFLRSGRSS